MCLIIDVACPFDTRIKKKEQEKIEHYSDLKYEILKCWNKEVEKVMILPTVIGALGTVTKKLRKNLDKVDLHPGLMLYKKHVFLEQRESSGRSSIQSEEQRSTAQEGQ